MQERFTRIFVIVLDSLGVGAMPDAKQYGDEGANTLGHIAERVEKLHIPNLINMGLGNLVSIGNLEKKEPEKGYYGVLQEKSHAKDTMAGHWEMMGIVTEKPFQTFTEHGFPEELILELEKQTGHKIIGNKSASGTAIIDEYGEEEIATGNMIVYTSADSVMQICGQEETFDLQELYRCCEIARKITMKDEWKVGRVIARPYVGKRKGEFVRTSNRHDYAVKPPEKTVLNDLQKKGLDVISVGKIVDIFCGEGITESHKSKSSVHGMEQTIELVKREFHGLCFVNLVDFDAKWGHRRNPEGYAKELEAFDKNLEVLLPLLSEQDLLILTADHGTDPTHHGTDHTREKVPFLAYSKGFHGHGRIEEQESFAVIGDIIAENFGIGRPENRGIGLEGQRIIFHYS